MKVMGEIDKQFWQLSPLKLLGKRLNREASHSGLAVAASLLQILDSSFLNAALLRE